MDNETNKVTKSNIVPCKACGGSGVSDISHGYTSTMVAGELVRDRVTVYFACETCKAAGTIERTDEND
jgi:hypothetical protein